MSGVDVHIIPAVDRPEDHALSLDCPCGPHLGHVTFVDNNEARGAIYHERLGGAS